jgi:hypothetical protein
MKNPRAPSAALIATVAVFGRLSTLEYRGATGIGSYQYRTPLLRAIFDRRAVGVLEIDLVGTLVLESALVFLAVFVVSWFVLSFFSSAVGFFRRPSVQAKPTMWEYCDLMEGRVGSGQTSEHRQIVRLLHHSQTGTKEQPASSRAEALTVLSQDGWEPVSVYTVAHSASISETHWFFKRPTSSQSPTSKQAESDSESKK